MKSRYELKNILNHKDKFRDNENKENLDSLDVVRILNHYDKVLTEFIKKHTEQQDKITDLEAKLAEKEVELELARNTSINTNKMDIIHLQAENLELKQQLAEKEKEISQLYPFVKEHNNGNFIEYNVIYERDGIVATTTFGKNKEMAYDYLKSLKGEK